MIGGAIGYLTFFLVSSTRSAVTETTETILKVLGYPTYSPLMLLKVKIQSVSFVTHTTKDMVKIRSWSIAPD